MKKSKNKQRAKENQEVGPPTKKSKQSESFVSTEFPAINIQDTSSMQPTILEDVTISFNNSNSFENNSVLQVTVSPSLKKNLDLLEATVSKMW